MIRPFNQRERSLLGIALKFYEDLAKQTEKNLARLGLQAAIVQTAIGNVKAVRMLLATSGDAGEVEFRMNLRDTTRKALELVSRKTEKVKGDQEQLLMPIDGTEEYEYELKALRRAFGEQLNLADVVEATHAAENGNGDKEDRPRKRRGRQGPLDDMPAR